MLRWFLKPLSVRQMRLLCANLLVGFALCGALQGLCWGRTQLDAGAALCADTLRLHSVYEIFTDIACCISWR